MENINFYGTHASKPIRGNNIKETLRENKQDPSVCFCTVQTPINIESQSDEKQSHHHHHHQPGERTHLLVVPGVHSNKSVEEVLNHVSFQPQSISRKHPSFFTAHQKSQTNRSYKFLSILA